MAGENMRRGGGVFVFEGEVSGPPRESTNNTTGELSWYVEVQYWGDRASLRLALPEQRSLLVRGAWVRVEAPIRKIKEAQYPGPATVTHVNDKPVGGVAARS